MKIELHSRILENTNLNRFSIHLLFVCCFLFCSTVSNANNTGEPENSNNPTSYLRPPANDDCSGAIDIPPNDPCGIVSGDSNTGTQSQAGCAGTANDDVWFRFTPLSSSPTITVTPNGTDLISDVVLEAFSGTCGALVSIGCVNGTNNADPEVANFTGLTIGTEYFIRIYSFRAQTGRDGEFDICLTDATPPPPLANDSCGFAAAFSLTPSANATCNTTTGGTIGANTEVELGECNIAGIAYDVWYSFMATATSHDVIVDGIAGFDTIITSVSNCTTGTSPSGGGTCIDATGDNGIETMNLTGLTIGNTYNVQVQDLNGDLTANAFTICVITPAIVTPPINDNCPGAIDIPPNSPCGIVSGDSNFGTQSQTGCSGTANDDVWFRFTPLSASPTITVTPNGTDPINDIVLEAFTGTCGALTSIGCVDGTNGAGVEGANFTGLTIGTEYFIRVYSFFASTADNGEFDICLTDSVPSGYCTPTTESPAGDYINSVQFLGSLNDIDNLNNGFANGYQDHTALAAGNSEQQQGEGFNVYVEGANSRGRFKAWIDWNNDLSFNEATEKVYDSGLIRTVSTTFGVVIPLAQTPGTYIIRIRFYHESNDSLFWDFTPCQDFIDYFPFGSDEYGEAEDYEFDVLARCDSDVVNIVNGEECGTSAVVTLGATGSAGVTEYYWYANETDRDAVNPVPLRLGTTNNIGATQNTTWDTPSISTTTTYWVTAWNGTCESYEPERVIAFLHQPATLTFTPTLPFICGEGGPRIQIAALSNTQIEYLIDEDFNTNGSLGSFSATNITSNGGDAVSQWQQHPSTPPYVPSENVWFPAISSGFGADNGSPNNGFALSNADTGFVPTENELESAVLDASNHLNLTLEFDMYFSRYNLTVPEYIYIEVSTNGGTTYLPADRIATITDDVGYGTDFEHRSYNLDVYAGQANLRVRVYYYSEWGDGVAIDNIQLYGQTSISPLVTWTSPAFLLGGIYQNATGGALYGGTPASSIWIQPSRSQLQASDIWSFTASVTLANGCTAIGSVDVENRTRYFEGATNDWSVASNWKPAFVPTSDNCVIVPNTYTASINGTYDADAFNVLVENGGEIIAQPSATITVVDAVTINTGGLFELEGVQQDAAQLIQINDVTNVVNGTFNLIRETNVRSQDYAYWSSPTDGYNFTNFGSSLIYQWTPTVATNLGFHGIWSAPSGNMIEGKGYAIRLLGTGNGDTPAWETITFNGVPRNGNVSIGIKRGIYIGPDINNGPGVDDTTNEDDNWNLIGNPYPSALNATTFLNDSANNAIDGSVYVWTHGTSIFAGGTNSPFYDTYVYNYNRNVDYLTYNSSGGTQAGYEGMIGSGQGFFVKMLDVGTSSDGGITYDATVTFVNTMRNKAFRNNQFFRTDNSNTTDDIERHRIWLDLITPSQNVNRTLIAYVEGATLEKDRNFDASVISGNGQGIYSVIDTDTDLIIQGRPLPFNTEDSVRLGMNLNEIGEQAIAINAIDGLFEDTPQDIFIEDLELGIIQNLKTGPYFFNVSETGIVDDRFVLRYTDNSLTIDEFNQNSGINIIAPNSDYIKVTSALSPIETITVYDMLGRVIIEEKDINASELTLDNKVYNGAYIVKTTLIDGKQKIQKVVLKN